MGVQGYLSLYTVLLGWQSYDAIWHILTQLGLVMLPFAFIATKTFIGPFLSMGAKDSGVIGSRRFVIEMLAALFVLLFAGAPMVQLDPSVLHYRPHCEKTGKVATPGNTGTTYDNLLPVPQNVKVPMIWYIVMAVSNGITDEAEDSISCPTVNLRALQNELNLTVIKGAALKREVGHFYQACYLPAYNKLMQDNDDGKNQTAIKSALSMYGNNDVSWIGSETLQNVSGFYDSFSAQNPVVGFPYTSSGVNNQINAQTGAPKWGAPTCKAWWQTPSIGLRSKLFAEFSQDTMAKIAEVSYGGDHKLAEDAAIKAMVEKSINRGFVNPGFYTEQDNQSGVDNFAAKWFSKYAIDKEALNEYPKIQIIKNALPIIQAVLLAAFCMMISIVLPLSSYSIRFVITASMFMFSVIFCSYLWHWVSWFDQFLLQGLYGAGTLNGHPDPGKLIYHLSEEAVNPEKNLVDLVISSFYVVLPMVWLSVMGWAGIAAGGAMSMAGLEPLSNKMGSQKLPKKGPGPGNVNNESFYHMNMSSPKVWFTGTVNHGGSGGGDI